MPYQEEIFLMNIKFNTEKGFTLIELMISIAIIGILATIAIPNFLAYRERAKIARAKSELKTFQTSLIILQLDTNMWPNNIDDAGIAAGTCDSGEIDDLRDPDVGLLDTNGNFPDWAGPYLDEIPVDPWGKDYWFDPDYRIDGVKRMVIVSSGPNGSDVNVYDEDNVVIVINDIPCD
jgi:prepilin-type N-terminal cleavage/methylation domain-containing protein